MTTIPFIDLNGFLTGNSEKRKFIARQVDEVCQSTGFLIIENHGVDELIINQAWSMAQAFFKLPLEQKLKVHSSDAHCPRGYSPPEFETLAKSRGQDTPPDRKETYSSGALSEFKGVLSRKEYDFYYGANLWPIKPSGFREAWVNYYLSMEQLGASIMQLFAFALHLPIDYFTQYHTHHISALRANNYPERTKDYLQNQFRAGAHSDYGSVTILRPDKSVGGLEIKLPSGEWQAAPMIGNAFIINIGDMLARWTNDRWVSTLHRVVDPEKSRARRLSIAYFQMPNFDARIQCITTCLVPGETERYAPVLAGKYLQGRFLSTI